MEEAKLQTLEQIRAFWDGTSEVAFRVPKEDRNQFIECVLKRRRPESGGFIQLLSGCPALRERF